ncbi:MAG TPA: hypothetical protein VFH58_05805 [Acidimicrobiales bacterium]|nr:hypothetical protein [Acidimicrobiales bacterium]
MAQVDDDIRDDSQPPEPPEDATRRHATRRMPDVLRWWPFGVALAVLVALDSSVYAFIKRHGVRETGDEPHYLVVARAVSHFTVHPLQAYKVDLRTHQLFGWPTGFRPSNLNLQLYTGPHGPVGDHPIGLSVFLAPFVAAGGERLARLAVMALACSGLIYFFHRTSRLAGLGARGRFALGAILAGPAMWLAVTQIYPDFLTGVLLACAFTDVVGLEINRRLDRTAVVVSAASVAFVPWLHQQNLGAAVLAAGAFLLLGWRTRRLQPEDPSWIGAVVIASVGVASWLLLLVFNLYEYGHAVGLPQPFPTLNGAGATEILGLLFDRHQGLFVQLPTAVIALVGMWLARRVAPVGLVASVIGAASLIYLNGTFIHAPYGGLTFAGRFQWSSLVPILVWCPFAVAAVQRVGKRAWGLAAAALALWVLQALPLIAGHHLYYNQQLLPGTPWDPATYPGWWGPLNRILPVLIPGGPQFGSPWFALPAAVAMLAVGTGVVAAATSSRRAGLVMAGPAALTAAAGAAVLAAFAPLPLPDRPLIFPGVDVGSPLVTGASGASVPVLLSGVSKGGYLVSVAYQLTGPSGSAVESYCQPERGGTRISSAAELGPDGHLASIRLRCPAGTISLDTAVLPNTNLRIQDVRITKTSAG